MKTHMHDHPATDYRACLYPTFKEWKQDPISELRIDHGGFISYL